MITADMVGKGRQEWHLMAALIVHMALEIANARRAIPPEILGPEIAHAHGFEAVTFELMQAADHCFNRRKALFASADVPRDNSIVPAFMYAQTQGSILEVLSKIGSYFVGANLGMYSLGFFSKHTSEKGLLVGVTIGFGGLWFVATKTTIAWPRYCGIGGSVTIITGILPSLVLTGKQGNWSRYSIEGQRLAFKAEGTPEKVDGWY